MKKLTLCLLTALAGFFFGTFTKEIFSIEICPLPLKSIGDINVADNQSPLPISPVEIIPETSENPDNQYFYGWYALKNYKYKGMPEVNMISLSKDNFNDDGTESSTPVSSAGIFTTLSDDPDEGFAQKDWAIITDNRVSFKTKKLKGIVYRFEGNFFKNKATGEEGEKLLRGTLQKFIKGKKVAEVNSDFIYYEPHCWH